MRPDLKHKDIQLRQTIEYLLEKHKNKIVIKDFWDADLCAIGLCDLLETRLIYISTFNLHENKFNIVLENLDKDAKPLNGKEFKEITFDRLEEIIRNHLRIDKQENDA